MTKYSRAAGLLLWMTLTCLACNKYYREAFPETEKIKKYGLAFRLQDELPRVAYLEKQGLADRAKAEKAKIAENNRNLVALFQQEFDFCPVRFYYASQQKDLLAGKPVLLNSRLEP
ncbi:MAG: hypothetical protein ABIQ93_17405, partial [Saprospiraceae bacterium]